MAVTVCKKSQEVRRSSQIAVKQHGAGEHEFHQKVSREILQVSHVVRKLSIQYSGRPGLSSDPLPKESQTFRVKLKPFTTFEDGWEPPRGIGWHVFARQHGGSKQVRVFMLRRSPGNLSFSGFLKAAKNRLLQSACKEFVLTGTNLYPSESLKRIKCPSHLKTVFAKS